MQIHWPLVISTACQRVGLGMFACAFLANLALGTVLPLNVVALATLTLLAVGGIASIFHLQTPARFFNAFSNFGSHLTQEALITPFLGIALLACGLNGFVYDMGPATIVVETAACILAAAFLACTGLAYQMRSRPAWNTGFVLGLFLLTAAEAGSIAVCAVCALIGAVVPTGLAVATGVLFVACVVVQCAYLARMRHVGYGVDVRVNEEPYKTVFYLWLAVGVACTGAGLAAGLAVASSELLLAAAVASALGIVAWTVLFFKGACKVKMFPMYPVDLNLDM